MGGHGFETVGVLVGEVVLFGAVGGDVVEFPRPVGALGDEFPFAIADGAVAFVLEVDGLAPVDGFAFEDGGEGGAFDGSLRTWVGCVAEVEASGHDVDEVGGLAGKGVLFGDSRRPMGDERGCDAAFVNPVFVFAEGGVGDVGPVFAVADFGFREARHDAIAPAEGVAVA